MSQRPTIAVQLYTLRNETAEDMAGVLKQVADLGYEAVELAGYGNLDLTAVHHALKENNLKVIGSHTNLEALQNNLETIIDESLVLGNKNVVLGWVDESWRSGEGYANVAKILDEVGARLNSAGLQLCYHNHAFEFEKYDGQYGLDLIYANSDAKFVQAELDTYWIQYGGEDPAAYITKYSGRVPNLHIKDMADDAERTFAEVGTGTLDWPAIFAAAEAAGVQNYIVEQDTCPGAPIDSVAISIKNLKEWGKLG